VHRRRARVRNRALRPLVLLLAATAWLVPALASAQVGGSRLHVGAGLALDFGGEAEFGTGDDDLEATFGLRGHLDYAVHRYLSIGGLTRMSWWEPDDVDIDRSFLFDLGPRVVGHFEWRDFRFYGGISPGLTISAMSDDAGVDNPAPGFTLSLTIAGMEWWFARHAGLFVELGWVGHWFEHEYENSANEVEIDLSQGMFELGFVFGV
jgi:hypothetical protein